MPDEVGSTVPRRQLGRQLKELREVARLTVRAAAAKLEWSTPKIWRIETGATSMRALDVKTMCEIYGASDELREALMGLAKETKSKGWWHSYGDVIPDDFDVYIGLEAAASRFRWYESELVPGLLQTEGYATAVVHADGSTSADEVPRRVQLRLDRQALLTRTSPEAPEIDLVVNEAILRRPVGGPEVMSHQLRHINEVGELPNVQIRVMPFDAGLHRGVMSGPFVLLDFPDDSEPTVIYVESWTGALYLEKPRERERYLSAFDDIDRRALDATTSRALIERTAEEFTGG